MMGTNQIKDQFQFMKQHKYKAIHLLLLCAVQESACEINMSTEAAEATEVQCNQKINCRCVWDR